MPDPSPVCPVCGELVVTRSVGASFFETLDGPAHSHCMTDGKSWHHETAVINIQDEPVPCIACSGSGIAVNAFGRRCGTCGGTGERDRVFPKGVS